MPPRSHREASQQTPRSLSERPLDHDSVTVGGGWPRATRSATAPRSRHEVECPQVLDFSLNSRFSTGVISATVPLGAEWACPRALRLIL